MALHLKSTGIDFTDFGDASATGSSTSSELLDDYEEGTWTPRMFGNSATELSLSTANGHFHKWGATVRCIAKCVCTNTNSAAGHLYVNQLPFACASGDDHWAQGGFINWADYMSISAGETLTLAVEPAASHAYFYYASTVGTSAMSPNSLSSDGHAKFNIVYVT